MAEMPVCGLSKGTRLRSFSESLGILRLQESKNRNDKKKKKSDGGVKTMYCRRNQK